MGDDFEDDDPLAILEDPTIIVKIDKLTIRRYCDNNQVKAFVDWTNSEGTHGTTEGDSTLRGPKNPHLKALFDRGKREGVKIEKEVWGECGGRKYRASRSRYR